MDRVACRKLAVTVTICHTGAAGTAHAPCGGSTVATISRLNPESDHSRRPTLGRMSTNQTKPAPTPTEVEVNILTKQIEVVRFSLLTSRQQPKKNDDGTTSVTLARVYFRLIPSGLMLAAGSIKRRDIEVVENGEKFLDSEFSLSMPGTWRGAPGAGLWQPFLSVPEGDQALNESYASWRKGVVEAYHRWIEATDKARKTVGPVEAQSAVGPTPGAVVTRRKVS